MWLLFSTPQTIATLVTCSLPPSNTNPLNFSNLQTFIKSHAWATAVSKLATFLISSCFFHFWQPFCTNIYFYDWHGQIWSRDPVLQRASCKSFIKLTPGKFYRGKIGYTGKRHFPQRNVIFSKIRLPSVTAANIIERARVCLPVKINKERSSTVAK